MKKQSYLRRKNLVKIIAFATTLFVSVMLISSSSMSITLTNISKSKKMYFTEAEEEISNGLAPPRKQIPVPSEMKSIGTEQTPIGDDCYIMYMEHAVSGGNGERFSIDTCDPGEIVDDLGDSEAGDFLSGGTFGCDQLWYGVEYGSSVLWAQDIYTGDMWSIGGGSADLNGLAWDPISNKMFGVASYDYTDIIYEIDPETGEQEQLFELDYSGGIMIGISFDAEGILYGWDLVTDKLWIIDLETEEVEEVGPLGIDLNYAQDGDFHRESDQLYLTAYTTTGQLYVCDKETGECELIGNLPNNWECTASCFENSCFTPEYDVGVKKILKPEDPSHAVPEMDMEIIVKNYGQNTETFDAQMEIYNQSSTILMEEDFSGPFPPEGWETNSWVQCNSSCCDDPPCACIYNESQYFNANITSKAVDASEYKKLRLTFYFAADFYYPQYCSLYVKFRRNESSPWKAIQPWDNPLEEGFEGDLFEIDIFSSEGCGEALQIQWEYFGYYYYSNYVCLDTIILEGTNDTIEYAELVEDITLDPGEVTTVEFPKWTPSYWQDPDYENTWQEFPVTAFTLLEGDQNPRNDYKWKIIDVYFPWFHDIEITSIDSPCEDGPGKTYPVKATIKNVGQYADCCIHIEISVKEIDLEPEYSDFACQGDDLEPGESRTFEFDDWTPDFLQYETTGSKDYIIQAEISMQGDQNPENDMKTEYFTLDYWHDVGIDMITSPGFISKNQDTLWDNGESDGRDALPGSMYQGNSNIIVDDFSNGANWIPTGGRFRFIWDSGYMPGNLETVKVYFFRNQDNCIPSLDSWAEVEVTDFSEWATGNIYFGRPEIAVDVEFEDVYLPCESKWYVGFQPDGITDDIAYMLTAESKGCQVMADLPYLGYQRWTSSQEIWGEEYDLAWELHGWHGWGCPSVYIQPGNEEINAIAKNYGTFAETDLTCYAEIWEYITDPENKTLVYEDNITNIDLEEPLGGEQILEFEDYTFAWEGIYLLDLEMPNPNDDEPYNNIYKLKVRVDDTEPISTHTLDPPEPDGENGWYVSDVEVTLEAYDPFVNYVSSGVKEIKYQIDDGPIEIITGSPGSFLLTQEHDEDDLEIKYWAIDNVGHEEIPHNRFTIDMDQTEPEIDLTYEVDGGNPQQGWKLIFTAYAYDITSLMDRVEFYHNDEWQETVYGPGPEYQWEFIYHGGLNLIITAKGFDIAGNMASDEVINPVSYNYNQNTQQQSSKSSYFLHKSQQNIFIIPGGGYR